MIGRYPVLIGPAAGQWHPCPPGGIGAIRLPRAVAVGDWTVDTYLLRRVVVFDRYGQPAGLLEGFVPSWYPLTGPVPGVEISYPDPS